MGYYGLGPGMRVADQLTPLEKALRSIPMENHQETLKILDTLLRNIAQKPSEEKFRKIKLGNAKISAAITSVKPAMEVLLIIGFKHEVVEGENFLVLPQNIKLNFPDHVNKVIDASDFFRKENEKVRVAKGLSRVAPADEKIVDPRAEADIAKAAADNIKWVGGGAPAQEL